MTRPGQHKMTIVPQMKMYRQRHFSTKRSVCSWIGMGSPSESGLIYVCSDERRYLEETKAYTFKAWLRKQPSSPWRDRLLSDQLVEVRRSRAYYQARMKRLNGTDEEMEDFIRLWKLMLMEKA